MSFYSRTCKHIPDIMIHGYEETENVAWKTVRQRSLPNQTLRFRMKKISKNDLLCANHHHSGIKSNTEMKNIPKLGAHLLFVKRQNRHTRDRLVLRSSPTSATFGSLIRFDGNNFGIASTPIWFLIFSILQVLIMFSSWNMAQHIWTRPRCIYQHPEINVRFSFQITNLKNLNIYTYQLSQPIVFDCAKTSFRQGLIWFGTVYFYSSSNAQQIHKSNVFEVNVTYVHWIRHISHQ